MDRQWKQFTGILKDQFSDTAYNTYFRQLAIDSVVDGVLKLKAPSAFIKQTVDTRYRSTLEQLTSQVFGKPQLIEIMVDPSLGTKKKAAVSDQEEGMTETEEDDYAPVFMGQRPNSAIQSGLNPNYTMDSYVVGLSNNLAYAAAKAVVQNPNITYNPLFIYGGTGVGKTHLMHAIGNALVQKNPTTKVIYCSSEKFMNDFVESIQTKKTSEFRNRYRSCNLLLIDDVQFIAGRDSTQEEFFHTFNELHSRNTQIVLTSDRPPYELQKLEPRLMSRFQAGLMVDVQTPDFDTRVAILRTKCQERGENVPEDCINLLAEHATHNARELEGKLIQIIETAKLLGQPVNSDYVRKTLGSPQPQSAQIDSKKVLGSVNSYFNLRMADLTGPRRNKELVLPRQLAMYILYTECGLPFEKIGSMIGGRDHTTVMHGVNKITEVINRDREVQRMFIEIKQAMSMNA